MPLFGPRLDRPSAIGDEGRPRATSLTIASLVVFAAVMAAGYLGDVTDLTLAIATLSGLTTAGLALLNRERFFALFLGQLCYVLGGTGLIGLLIVLLAVAPSYGLLFTGFALALMGLATTWADVANDESTKAAVIQGGVSYLAMILWFVVVLFVGAIMFILWTFLTSRAASIPPTPSLLAFLFVISGAGVLVWLGTRWLPFRQLTPRDRRDRLVDRVGRLRFVVGVSALFGYALVIVALVVWAVGGFDLLYAAAPPVSALFRGLSSPLLLGPVLLVGVAVLVAALVAFVLRRVTRPRNRRSNRLLAAVLAGFAFNLVFLPFLFSVVPVPGELWAIFIGLLVVLGPVALFLVGTIFHLGVISKLLPGRAGGPAVAATGMVIATIGAGLVGVPSVVAFACATAGMVAWDVSAFGLGVTADIGHLPETRRIELFHGVLGVGVGVVVLAGLTALDVLRTTVAAGVVAGPAILLAVIAVLFLLIPVRG